MHFPPKYGETCHATSRKQALSIFSPSFLSECKVSQKNKIYKRKKCSETITQDRLTTYQKLSIWYVACLSFFFLFFLSNIYFSQFAFLHFFSPFFLRQLAGCWYSPWTICTRDPVSHLPFLQVLPSLGSCYCRLKVGYVTLVCRL